eukprot:763395-Hanusia_phi.AAC.1
MLSVDDAVAALYPMDVHPSCLLPSISPPSSPHQSQSEEASAVVSPSSPRSPVSPIHAGSSPDSQASSRRKWTADEHARFLAGLQVHVSSRRRDTTGVRDSAGKLRVGLGRGAARKIAQAVGTRDEAQVRSHAQKYFQQLVRTGRDWRAVVGVAGGEREGVEGIELD